MEGRLRLSAFSYALLTLWRLPSPQRPTRRATARRELTNVHSEARIRSASGIPMAIIATGRLLVRRVAQVEAGDKERRAANPARSLRRFTNKGASSPNRSTGASAAQCPLRVKCRSGTLNPIGPVAPLNRTLPVHRLSTMLGGGCIQRT
jgi:hypothetical protein